MSGANQVRELSKSFAVRQDCEVLEHDALSQKITRSPNGKRYLDRIPNDGQPRWTMLRPSLNVAPRTPEMSVEGLAGVGKGRSHAQTQDGTA